MFPTPLLSFENIVICDSDKHSIRSISQYSWLAFISVSILQLSDSK